MIGVNWKPEHHAYCRQIINGGETCTKVIQRRMSEKFGREFSRVSVDKEFAKAGISRNRRYEPALRQQFQALCRQHPQESTRELLTRFARQTGEDIYFTLGYAWRKGAA